MLKSLAKRYTNDQFGCVLIVAVLAIVSLFFFAISNAHAADYSLPAGVQGTPELAGSYSPNASVSYKF